MDADTYTFGQLAEILGHSIEHPMVFPYKYYWLGSSGEWFAGGDDCAEFSGGMHGDVRPLESSKDATRDIKLYYSFDVCLHFIKSSGKRIKKVRLVEEGKKIYSIKCLPKNYFLIRMLHYGMLEYYGNEKQILPFYNS